MGAGLVSVTTRNESMMLLLPFLAMRELPRAGTTVGRRKGIRARSASSRRAVCKLLLQCWH